ncbi:B-cell receptor CD22-like isoform X2 [Gymnodraco acuticeps]|uniref:B-cell receptor CD22 n=1 Tax=Gymnodraco acuticeps TaxID=8218 RepID=A0A6P8W555_GYMAC|nr:B-cell receptor CD22-like isoform X2 [Gymnodraco acuticeps]
MRAAAMGPSAATGGFVVFFLSVSVVQSRKGYISVEMCAVRGSTVDIRCSYRAPSTGKRSSVSVKNVLWFTDTQEEGPVDLSSDSEYAGRVKYYCDKTTCTLRISDLRESDSAEYKFKFKDKPSKRFTQSGVTLSVTGPDVQVQVSRLYISWVELQCRSSCHLPDRPSFIWYKNGQKIQEETSSSYSDYFIPADSYSCAVRGHEDFPAPSVCVNSQTCNRVIYTERSICAPKGSSVDIYCTYSSSEALQVQVIRVTEHQFSTYAELHCRSSCSPAAGLYVWFKNLQRNTTEETSNYADFFYSGDNISCAFKGHEASRSPSLYAPKLPSVSVSPSAEIEEGSSVTLTCSSDANPAANYTWYKKDGNFISLNEGPQLVFSSIQSSDSAEYFCTAENKLGRISKHVFINVKYAPKLPSVSVSPSAEIKEGSSVTLTCSSDANPAANYTWYKEDEDSPKASGQIFNITDFRAEHSGSYSCGAENKLGCSNSTLNLSVVKVREAYRSLSDHESREQPGSHNSSLHPDHPEDASRSHIGITLGFLLFIIIIILSAYLRTRRYSLTNQRHKLRQRLNSMAQTLPPLTCPQFVLTVFSALTNHLTRISRTRWRAECSSI